MLAVLLVSVVACLPIPTAPPPVPFATATPVATSTIIGATAIPVDTPAPAQTRSRSPMPTVTPTEVVYPWAFQIADLAFVDALHGWALGQYRNANNIGTTAMRMTVDGGRTWRVIPAPETKIIFGLPAVSKIRFANSSDGWAFDPGLFSTRDGGQTWTDEGRQGDVIAVEPPGETAWAIERTCQDALTKNDCQFTLLFLDQSGQAWQSAPTPLPATAWRLVRVSAKEAWLLSTEAYWTRNETHQQVWVTRDGGQTWSEPNPSASISGCEHLAMDETRQLWLLCGGGMATDMEKKWLLISKDEGKHWTRIGDDSMPILGGITDLSVVSNQRAFIALGDGFPVIATEDGGHTWRDSLEYPDAIMTGGLDRVLFVDGLHGWATLLGNLIARTEDGGTTWEQVALP